MVAIKNSWREQANTIKCKKQQLLAQNRWGSLYNANKQQEKLPSGDFFVTIARKIIQYEFLFRKGAY